MFKTYLVALSNMYKFTKQHKDSAIGDVCTHTGDYLQALIDAGIVEEVKQWLKGMPSMNRMVKAPFISILSDGSTVKTTEWMSPTMIKEYTRGNYFPTEQAAKEHNN